MSNATDVRHPRKGSESEDFAARLQRLEDERRILQLIDLHAMLSDAGPAEGFAELYVEDCLVDLGEILVPGTRTIIEGRRRLLEDVYLEPGHRAAEGRTQHFRAGPQIIQIDRDAAEAVTYVMTMFLADGTPKQVVTGFNFWSMSRRDGRWRIAKRIHRRLGDSDVPALFKPLVERTLNGLA
jgi:hypothetical protein